MFPSTAVEDIVSLRKRLLICAQSLLACVVNGCLRCTCYLSLQVRDMYGFTPSVDLTQPVGLDTSGRLRFCIWNAPHGNLPASKVPGINIVVDARIGKPTAGALTTLMLPDHRAIPPCCDDCPLH